MESVNTDAELVSQHPYHNVLLLIPRKGALVQTRIKLHTHTHEYLRHGLETSFEDGVILDDCVHVFAAQFEELARAQCLDIGRAFVVDLGYQCHLAQVVARPKERHLLAVANDRETL